MYDGTVRDKFTEQRTFSDGYGMGLSGKKTIWDTVEKIAELGRTRFFGGTRKDILSENGLLGTYDGTSMQFGWDVNECRESSYWNLSRKVLEPSLALFN